MTPDYALVLTEHYTGRSFSIEETYESIEALDGGDVPPQSALDDLWPQVQAERANAQARAARHADLIAEADPLFMQWQAGEGTEEEWLSKREEIRNRHPYVEVPE